MEKYDKFTVELGRVRIAESGAIGTLKGTVAGLLIRFEVGLTVRPERLGQAAPRARRRRGRSQGDCRPFV